MDASWKEGEDYFIRLRPISNKSKGLTQDYFEKNVVIKLMQMISGLDLPVNSGKRVPVRVESYGSWKQAQMDVLKEAADILKEEFERKRKSKVTLTDNNEKIRWAAQIQKINDSILILSDVYSIIKKEFDDYRK